MQTPAKARRAGADFRAGRGGDGAAARQIVGELRQVDVLAGARGERMGDSLGLEARVRTGPPS